MRNKKAFTIIEVVLVLAVAGLIFLVVFAAVPRLQASRRDNARKRDAEHLLALIQEYQSNTGNSPSLWIVQDALTGDSSSAFYDYGNDTDFQNPSGGDYPLVDWTTYNATTTPGAIYTHYGRQCNATRDGPATKSGDIWFVVSIRLERGSYCADNS